MSNNLDEIENNYLLDQMVYDGNGKGTEDELKFKDVADDITEKNTKLCVETTMLGIFYKAQFS